ncbi:MAG: MlaD family protein [Gammaproteobacteria bacterium]|nr:MlaD family protein [Gammaproteobacteria bacterium]
MSKKSNPTLIGAFVVGGVLLIAAGVALFGGSELFQRKSIYVTYFEDRVKGLRVGANVLLQGVRVGYVSDIDLLADVSTIDTTTEVKIEILPDTFIVVRDGVPIDAQIGALISHERLVEEAGLRAQLAVESFITGQLLIELEFRPGTEPIFRGVDPPYPEIPTVKSGVQEMLTNVQDTLNDIQARVDFVEVAERLASAIKGLDELANSEDVRETLAGVNRFVNAEKTQQIPSTLDDVLAEVRDAAEDAGVLFRDADEDINQLAEDLKPVVERFGSALTEAERTLAAAKVQLQGDTEQVYRLQTALTEVERAAKAVREFFDYLERNPEALLRGKNP